MTSFKEIFNVLQSVYHKQQDTLNGLDYYTNKNFWEVISLVDDNQLLIWAERATRIKTPIFGPQWIVTEWTRLCSIVDQVKNKNSKGSIKQKRFTALMICKYWDDLLDLYPSF